MDERRFDLNRAQEGMFAECSVVHTQGDDGLLGSDIAIRRQRRIGKQAEWGWYSQGHFMLPDRIVRRNARAEEARELRLTQR